MRNGHTTTSAYKMTPQLHESALRPSYLIPCNKRFSGITGQLNEDMKTGNARLFDTI